MFFWWVLAAPQLNKGNGLLGRSGPLRPHNSCDQLQRWSSGPAHASIGTSLSKSLYAVAEDVLWGSTLGVQWARW